MNMKLLRRAALTIVLASVGASAYCQDLIARQAPVDRRLRAVDSVAIQRAVDRDIMNSELSSDVYNSWVTNRAHPYSSSEVPESYRIDLRGFCMPTPSRNITSRFGYRPTFKRVHKGLGVHGRHHCVGFRWQSARSALRCWRLWQLRGNSSQQWS